MTIPTVFRLAAFDPADTGGLDKDDAQAMLADDLKRLGELQQRLYTDGRWALLVVLQGMDAAGKDGVIEHVMTGLNPQGCNVHAFKAPSEEDLAHDFLWRAAVRVPERRRIGIFNRSHYEETLVVRVHPELLERQKIPPQLVGKIIWKERFYGASLADAVKQVVYVTDVRFQADVAKCRREAYVDGPIPANTFLVISALAIPGMLLEIDVTAVVSK